MKVFFGDSQDFVDRNSLDQELKFITSMMAKIGTRDCLLLSKPLWLRLGQETCHLNATCPILSGSRDYTLSSYPTTLRFSFNDMMSCVHPWPTLKLMFE